MLGGAVKYELRCGVNRGQGQGVVRAGCARRQEKGRRASALSVVFVAGFVVCGAQTPAA